MPECAHLWMAADYRWFEGKTELANMVCIRCGTDHVTMTTSGIGGVRA